MKSHQQTIMIVFGVILAYILLRTFYLGEQKIIEGITNNNNSPKELLEKIQSTLIVEINN